MVFVAIKVNTSDLFFFNKIAAFCHHSENKVTIASILPHLAQAKGIFALGKALTVFIGDKRMMSVSGRRYA